MAVNTKLPKWATLDRQNCLVRLWASYGNKCLLGHTACPILSHYLQVETKGVKTAIPIQVACRYRDGSPQVDSNGNPKFLTQYKTIAIPIKSVITTRLYDKIAGLVIAGWIEDDRIQRKVDWLAEEKAIHSLGERTYPLRGQFSAISQSIYADTQPLYFLEGLAISGLTLKPFAKIRIASSYMRLFVDLKDTLKPVSKNKRRKAIRYGKPLPKDIEANLQQTVGKAVRHYLAH